MPRDLCRPYGAAMDISMEREMERDIDGVSIVPLDDGDERTVQAVFDGMSPEARFFRFLQAMPALRPSLRTTLAAVDGTRQLALVARLHGAPVGIVRVHATEHGDVEMAVSVVDAARRRGIGRALVERALAMVAARGDAREVSVLVHPENRASIDLFTSVGARFELDEGLLVGRVPVGALELVA